MAEYKKKAVSKRETPEEEVVEATTVDTSDVDALLDEIDEILEENAQEFVEQYIQKGGQ